MSDAIMPSNARKLPSALNFSAPVILLYKYMYCLVT